MIYFPYMKRITIPEGEVTKITDANGNVLWSKATSLDNYLLFSSDYAFTISVAKPGWDGTMEYNNGNGWTVWDGSKVTSRYGYIAFRGTGNTKVTGDLSSDVSFTLAGTDIKCSGNIETLLDYATVAAGKHPTMAANYCYSIMFLNCESLITPPSLPATTLTTACYARMFEGCINLKTAPALPFTKVASLCCYLMFNGCASLTTVPALHATTLAANCFNGMFNACVNIKLSASKTGKYTKAYRIPTTGTSATADGALTNMFAYTGGTFTGTPTINTTYYLDESNTIV